MLVVSARSILAAGLIGLLFALAQSTSLGAANPPEVKVDQFGDPLPAGAMARLGTTRFRPGGSVEAAALSPDGKTLATAVYRDLAMWQTATGRILWRCNCARVFMLAFADKGKTLVAVNQLGEAVFLSVVTGKESSRLKLVKPADSYWREGAMTADGRFAALRETQSIQVWDLTLGKEVRRIPAPRHSGPLALTPDGATLAALNGFKILLWDVASGKQKAAWSYEKSNLGLLCFSPDGKTLVSAGTTRAITSWAWVYHPARSWDVATGKEKHRFGKRDNWNIAVGISPDGKLLATTNPDDTVVLWDMTTGKEIRRWPIDKVLFRSSTDSLIFSPDASVLILAGNDPVIRLWNPANGKKIIHCAGPMQPAVTLRASADGKLLAAAHGDSLWIWDVKSTKELCQSADPLWYLRTHGEKVDPAAFTPDGKQFAYAHIDNSVRLCATSTGKEVRSFDGHSRTVRHLTFGGDGKTLFTAGADETLRIWDVASGKELRRWPIQKPTPIPQVDQRPYYCFSCDGQRLMAGYSSQAWPPGAKAWEECNSQWQFSASTGKRLGAWLHLSPRLEPIALSPNGRIMAGLDRKGGLDLYELATGTKRLSLRPAPVPARSTSHVSNSLAFSPDSRLLAAPGQDGETVCLYDVVTGKRLRTLKSQQNGIAVLLFIGNDVLASAEADNTILLWDVSAQRQPVQRTAVALQEEELSKLWNRLGSDNVHEALWKLSAGSNAVRFLKGKLRPVAGPMPAQLARWLRELDDDRFAVREKAMQSLRDLGELAESALRQYVNKSPGLEGGRRAARLLQALENREGLLTSEQLLTLRALEVLENIGAKEAEELVAELAKGAAEARLTREADATLNRMRQRSTTSAARQ